MCCNTKILPTAILMTCLILNSIGAAPTRRSSGNGDLNPPQITSFSPAEDPIIYKYNQTWLSLSCSAKSDEIVTWRWLRNGENIMPGDGYIISKSDDNSQLDNQSSLVILATMIDLESNYTCHAGNKFGNDSYTFTIIHKEKEWAMETIGLPIMLCILLLGMGLFMIYFRLRPSPPPHMPLLEQEQIDIFFNGPRQQLENADGIELGEVSVSQLPYDYNKEIRMESLVFGRYIGGGISGKVEAVTVLNWPVEGEHKQGAAKSIKKDPSMTHEQFELAFLDFIHKEIKISQLVCSFGSHENVVGYIGSVVEDLANYKAHLIVEYCSGGDLQSLLEKHGQEGTFYDVGEHGEVEQEGRAMLKTSHLIKWAEQIAAGLEHMASLNIPHMDLATRNILLAHEDPELNTERYLNPDPAYLIAKISDFGMARELSLEGKAYYRKFHPDEPERNTRARWLPLRWMSIEALESGRFSLQSDIWSLGVTLWEMFTLGGFPYEDLQLSPRSEMLQLIKYFKNGGILPEPPHVPPKIWDIMRDCWSLKPEERPSPGFIREELHQLNKEIREQLENRTTESSPEPSSANGGVIYVQIESMEPEQAEERPRYVYAEVLPV